jgi:predicted NACHT family NTPase
VLLGKPVPLRIELRLLSEARKQRAGYSFLSYACEVMLGKEDVVIQPQMFKELLERRAMLLLFDGLDEVATLAERQQLISDIESFTQKYPGNRILVTSRPVGYDLASFADRLFRHCEVQDFDDEQIHRFIESWYTHVLKYSPLPTDIRQELEAFYSILEQNERLHRLAANPLLLTVMTALHRYERLPDERVLIYEKCADLLLDTWAKLKYEDSRWKDMKMSKSDQVSCLAHLGFVLHKRSQEAEISNTTGKKKENQSSQDTAVDVPASFIQREIKRFLASQNLLSGAEQNAETERFLELVRIEAGLIVARGTDETGETLYGFVTVPFRNISLQ